MQDLSNKEQSLSSTSILVVDDDDQLRLLFRYKLEEEGYRVFEAATGEESIEIYQKETPTLILMDAVMQGMDGFDACSKILDLARAEKPIVLMTTSLNDGLSVTKAYAAGAADYVTKPIHWAVLSNRIKHLIKAQSVELLQQKLEQQNNQVKKMATIHRMVGGLAHDFNNLLTGVIGYSELARNLPPEDTVKLKSYLSEIGKAGSRAKTLIQKLLTFSQDTPAKLLLTDPAIIINESVSMVRESFPASIEIIDDVDEHLPQVLIDPVHIYQCIINLCLNAREAMNSKGALTVSLHTVKLETTNCASCLADFGGELLEISVRDTGKGIQKNNLPKIFDPFFTTHEMSTGLGLSVVHGIVHEHHGHIRIESKEKLGSVFRIFLPLPKN
ncbi:MAG: response regulator [Gammaproteobacteria bacterium]|nr:response regulator [Gammaproteobacteria bacterium]